MQFHRLCRLPICLPFPISALCLFLSLFGSSVSLSLFVTSMPLFPRVRRCARRRCFPRLFRKSRYFRLVGYVLSYYESRDSLTPVLGGVHLNSTFVRAEPDSLFGMPFTFSITQTQAEQRTYYCVANDKEEMEEWSVAQTTDDNRDHGHGRRRVCRFRVPPCPLALTRRVILLSCRFPPPPFLCSGSSFSSSATVSLPTACRSVSTRACTSTCCPTQVR